MDERGETRPESAAGSSCTSYPVRVRTPLMLRTDWCRLRPLATIIVMVAKRCQCQEVQIVISSQFTVYSRASVRELRLRTSHRELITVNCELP